MKRYIISAACLIVLFGAGCGSIKKETAANKSETNDAVSSITERSDKWFKLVSGGKTFSISFPVMPKAMKLPRNDKDGGRKLEGGYTIFYYGEPDSISSYALGVGTFTEDSVKNTDDESLRDTLAGITAPGSNNTLVSSEFKNVKNGRALDFIVKYPAYLMYGRILQFGRTQYNFQASYYKNNYNEGDYLKFINSFELL